jgi:hypothetical protein
MQLFLNGTLDSSIFSPGAFTWYQQSNNVVASLGGYCHSAATIREVLWLNKAATAPDIDYLMNSFSPLGQP